MSFLSLAFLWGVPLFGVPMAIHLLSRRRQEVVKWSAMQFLMASNIRRRSLWRIDDLILMLLRALSVLGLILALARPMWHGANLIGGADRHVIFLWDVSMSMGRQSEGRDAFHHLLEKTAELFQELGPTDSVQGLVTIGPGEWLTTAPLPATNETKQQILQQLEEIGVTEASADWFRCLNSALREPSPPSTRAKLIVVLSDGQAEGWRTEDQTGWQTLRQLAESAVIPTAVDITNVLGSKEPANNLAITKLSSPHQLLGVGQTIIVEAAIENLGTTTLQSANVEWNLDEKRLGTTPIGQLHGGQSTKVFFKLVPEHPGLQRLTCRLLVDDDLPADNEQTVILEMIDHISVLLVDDSQERDPFRTDRGYVLAALGQSETQQKIAYKPGIFRVTVISTAELPKQTLSAFRAIIFPNTPSLNEDIVARIADFVRQGGGLWLALGDRTVPGDFVTQFYRHGGGLCPWAIQPAEGDVNDHNNAFSIHPPEAVHPATMLLGDTQRLDIDRVKIFRRFPFTTTAARDDVPIILKSSTAEPLAIEGFLGRGRVIIQSFPLGIGWSNLPLMQAYVPLVHEWLSYLIQPSSENYNLLAGEPLQVALPLNEHVREVQLHKPHGKDVSLMPFSSGERMIVRNRDTTLPGNYSVVMHLEGKLDDVRPFHVAGSDKESRLSQWSAEFLAKHESNSWLRFNPRTPFAMPDGVINREMGKPLWGLLLGVVVLALLTELWLVRWIAARRWGFSRQPSSPRPVLPGQLWANLEEKGAG